MKQLLSIPFLLFFMSCDCVYQSTGLVTDAQTGTSLDSVSFHMEGSNYPQMTNKDGKFDVHEITGFTCGCKGIVFEKAGYKSVTVDVDNNDSIVVKMEKAK